MGCVRCLTEHPAGASCPAALEGQRHGPLLLRKRLGTRASGTLYLAEYPPTGHRFAVKVLRPREAGSTVERARLLARVRAATRLIHPHVVRVLDVRPGPGGHLCVLMEYVEGVALCSLPLPLTPSEAVELLAQALEALRAAHAQGLAHGALQARHLLLTRGEDGARCLKLRGLGQGDAARARADVWAVARLGYQLVTGQPPASEAPAAPRALNPSVPPALCEVLLRAVSPRPEARYLDAQALLDALSGRAAAPPADAELASLLARATPLREDPYALLGAAPGVDFDEVLRRAEAALRRLDSFASRALPEPQRHEWRALRDGVEAARRTLGEPRARLGFDVLKGNVAGILRCLAAGLPEAEVAPLRHAFLEARPDAEARARALFSQGHALEVQRALGPALERYAEALALDPLNVPWLSHYLALCQQVRAAEAPCPPRASEGGAVGSGPARAG